MDERYLIETLAKVLRVDMSAHGLTELVQSAAERMTELEKRIDMWPKNGGSTLTQGALDSLIGQRDRAWERAGVMDEKLRVAHKLRVDDMARISDLNTRMLCLVVERDTARVAYEEGAEIVAELKAAQKPRPMSELPADGSIILVVSKAESRKHGIYIKSPHGWLPLPPDPA